VSRPRDHQRFASDPAQKVLEKAHHILSFEGPLLLHHIEFALEANATDHLSVIA
jgi:hypothetical protein